MRLILEATDGPIKNKKIWLRKNQTATVGKSHWADFPLPSDDSLADVHFRVESTTEGCTIESLEKAHPTFVNDVEVDEVSLLDGDRIRAGDTTFEVIVEHASESLTYPTQLAPPIEDESRGGPASKMRVQAITESGRNILVDAPEHETPDDTPDIEGPYELVIPAIVEVDLDIVCKGEQEQRVLAPGDCLTFGRSTKADIGLAQDAYLSSVHFVVECHERTCMVRDLDSTNGTAVDGQDVSRAPVRTGQVIDAGETKVKVRVRRRAVPLPPGELETLPSGLVCFSLESDATQMGELLQQANETASVCLLANLAQVAPWLEGRAHTSEFLYDWLPSRFQSEQSPSVIWLGDSHDLARLSQDAPADQAVLAVVHASDRDTLVGHLRVASRGRSDTWSAADEAHMFGPATPSHLRRLLAQCKPDYAQFLFSNTTAFVLPPDGDTSQWQIIAASIRGAVAHA